jgi:molybdenum cofactor cytidylyltransferase
MQHSVYTIILAAGSASRFGSTKQLAVVDGQALVSRAVTVANDACDGRSVVVVGHDAVAVAEEVRASAGFIVVNDHHSSGLGTSLARAVRSIRHVASAVVVMLADQPGINTQHLASLIDTWSGDADEIIATVFGETQGPPVLFPSMCFDDLQDLSGDAGGKHLFDDKRFRLRTIEFAPAELDIDTAADLESLRGA